MDNLYNKNGNIVAGVDGDRFFSCNGKNIGFLKDGCNVYNYDGKQLGWFKNGWLIDLNSECVCFTKYSSNEGPIKPVCSGGSVTSCHEGGIGTPGCESARNFCNIHSNWSNLSAEEYFF